MEQGKTLHFARNRIHAFEVRQTPTCQNVLNKMSGKSTAYINDIYQAMNFIFSKAVQNELIKSNPAEYVVRPQGTKARRRAITSVEEEHIRKVAVMDRRYYLYLLMLDCGCRPSEAAEARGEDIIIVDGYNMLHIRGTKSVNADRIVPLPDGLHKLIKNTHRESYIACNRMLIQICRNFIHQSSLVY